jgi:hypothetical protein
MAGRIEDATDWVVGGAEPRARRALASDLLSDSRFATEVEALQRDLAPLAARGGEAAPLPGVWEAIDAALDAEAAVDAYSANRRVDEAGWEARGPGVWRKRLWDDNTFLARIAPGHVFAAHTHDVIEHCVVVAGSMVVDGVRFGPGDYHAPAVGSRHASFGTPDGLLVLVRYEAG